MKTECRHTVVKAHVEVNNLADTGRWVAELKLSCVECEIPFRFLGVPDVGMLMTAPAIEVGGTEIRLPIAPGAMSKDEIPAVLEYQIPARAKDALEEQLSSLKVPIQTVADLAVKLEGAYKTLDEFRQKLRLMADPLDLPTQRHDPTIPVPYCWCNRLQVDGPYEDRLGMCDSLRRAMR